MTNKNENTFFNKLFQFSIRMSGASIAIVGLLLVVTYEFQHAGEFTESFKWLRIAHTGTGSAIFFSITSLIGLIIKAPFIPIKFQKIISYIFAFTFLIGESLLIYILYILFINTL